MYEPKYTRPTGDCMNQKYSELREEHQRKQQSEGQSGSEKHTETRDLSRGTPLYANAANPTYHHG